LLGAVIAGDSWRSWQGLLIAAIGEEFSEDAAAFASRQRIDEFAAVIERSGGGKSRAMATLATYIVSAAPPALWRGPAPQSPNFSGTSIPSLGFTMGVKSMSLTLVAIARHENGSILHTKRSLVIPSHSFLL
jgi:hypothetical protein